MARNYMTLGEYKEIISKTALYPGAGTGNWEELSYLTLGLIGEVGEYQDNPTISELGDICWYLVNLYGVIEKKAGLASFNFDMRHAMPMRITSLLANKMKKLLRDGEDQDKLREIHTFLYRLWNSVADEAMKEFKVDLGYVYAANSQKLLSRKERGVITGSGDKR